MYQYGKTEITLGEIRVSDRFKIATKANPFYDLDTAVTTSAPKCGLSRVALQKQLNDSLSNLKIKKVASFLLSYSTSFSLRSLGN